MNADTVLLRGWATTGDAAGLVRELLGAADEVRSTAAAEAVWQIGEPLRPDEPVGRPSSFTVLAARAPVEVDILIGSQGLDRPPDRDGAGVVRVAVTPRAAVVLDARCWYRPAGAGIRAGMWRAAV